jgi:hypothetical protein
VTLKKQNLVSVRVREVEGCDGLIPETNSKAKEGLRPSKADRRLADAHQRFDSIDYAYQGVPLKNRNIMVGAERYPGTDVLIGMEDSVLHLRLFENLGCKRGVWYLMLVALDE